MEINIKNIIQRLKSLKSFNSDEQLAEYMGVTRAAVSTWKARNSIDYTLIFEKFPDYSLNYIIYGKADVMQNAIQAIEHNNTTDTAKCNILIAENNLLKEQLKEQRRDYIKEIERLSSGRHNSELEANIVKAG